MAAQLCMNSQNRFFPLLSLPVRSINWRLNKYHFTITSFIANELIKLKTCAIVVENIVRVLNSFDVNTSAPSVHQFNALICRRLHQPWFMRSIFLLWTMWATTSWAAALFFAFVLFFCHLHINPCLVHHSEFCISSVRDHCALSHSFALCSY